MAVRVNLVVMGVAVDRIVGMMMVMTWLLYWRLNWLSLVKLVKPQIDCNNITSDTCSVPFLQYC